MSSYAVAPIFLIRATGVPFEHLERLATTRSSEIARRLLATRSELAEARGRAEEFVGSRASGLSADESRAYRALLRNGAGGNGSSLTGPEPIARFSASAHSVHDLDGELRTTLEQELEAARRGLMESSHAVLPGYLVFGAGEFRDRVPAPGQALPSRNARTRERERHLLLYLQRVCAKNDTYSEYGPSAWGTLGHAVEFKPEPGIARRHAFLERWTAHTFAAAVNAEAAVRDELAPRLNPNGRIEGDAFVFADSSTLVPLSADELDVLRRCDGRTPAHQLDAAPELLGSLASRRLIVWQLEVPALEPHAFEVLAQQIGKWRETPATREW
ncbi:MAG TPA: hypothetical protein VF683_04205, partial [Chthoniobacterales bacterium]